MGKLIDKLNTRSLTHDQKQQAIMIYMVINKIKNKYKLKSKLETYNFIGYCDDYVRDMIFGKRPLTQRFIKALLFYAGISYEDLNREFVDKELDQYINSVGHLVIDGIDYGKI